MKAGMLSAIVIGANAVLNAFAAVPVQTAEELSAAINSGAEGDTVVLAEGTFLIAASLKPQVNMCIHGAGAGQTIIAPAASWNPGADSLPDKGTDAKSIVRSAYLIDAATKKKGITIEDLTLSGGRVLHGALYGYNSDYLTIRRLRIEKFIWSSIRTFSMTHAQIHDNEFVDAGGRHGHSGGALYLTWADSSEFWNNRISKTAEHTSGHFYGFKGRQGRNSRFHHNTVTVNFSFEFPFDNDQNVEIDHNYFTGVISIPKSGGGPVPAGGYTFHIHHNYLSSSYAIEWPRNGVEVDHNLFDFDTAQDGGNLFSSFANTQAPGPLTFHDNLVKNPGRGVFWAQGAVSNLSFYNNHVIANTTITPRTDGLFGFNTGCDFSTIVIKDNIFECRGISRPLMRNDASYNAVIENNTLINISDSSRFENQSTGEARGPAEALSFRAGVNSEYAVNGWDVALEQNAAIRRSVIKPASARSFKFFTGKAEAFTVSGRRLARVPGRTGRTFAPVIAVTDANPKQPSRLRVVW